jgi:peptide chain release factor 1
MFENLSEMEKRYEELGLMLSSQDIFQNPEKFKDLSKEYAQIKEILTVYHRYQKIESQILENQELLLETDQEMKELARLDIQELETAREKEEKELNLLLLPKDPNDSKNTLLEIRAGTGGEEAALFAATLFRMYSRYAETKRWEVEVMSRHVTGRGGFKEMIVLIQGARVYSSLKYEAGVHRVQRIPETETQGRIHTSAVTVAVLPEADEVDVKIDPIDLRIDIFRASGPGGQHVNTTDSAIRITHIPSGIVVSCQDEKSQHKNKAKAMRILSARLKDKMEQEQHSEIAQQRKSMVGSGDRSERIRTYNFPQTRITDHRIGLTLHRLEEVLAGNLDLLVDPIHAHFQAEALKNPVI